MKHPPSVAQTLGLSLRGSCRGKRRSGARRCREQMAFISRAFVSCLDATFFSSPLPRLNSINRSGRKDFLPRLAPRRSLLPLSPEANQGSPKIILHPVSLYYLHVMERSRNNYPPPASSYNSGLSTKQPSSPFRLDSARIITE
jgi:hypothetical protein